MAVSDFEVPDVLPRVQYVATNGQTAFTIPFRFFEGADVKVLLDDSLVPEDAADYVITGDGLNSNGTLTFDVGQTGGTIVTIYRDSSIERIVNFFNSGEWTAQNVNDQLNRLTMFIQEVALRANELSVMLPINTTLTSVTFPDEGPASNADCIIAWDPTGEFLVNGPTITELTTVFASIDNIDTVAANIDDVNTVADDISDVVTVSTNILNVNLVGGSVANVNTVAGSIGSVNTTAGAIANVNTVAGAIANVNTVAANIANVNTVAGISADVTTCAANIVAIQNAPTEAAAAAASAAAAEASRIATAALLDQFDDRYLGSKSADPTLDNDGNALIDGALYYNTVANNLRVYDLGTTSWGVIDSAPDEKVKVSANDTTGGYLNGKLVGTATDGITLTENNDGANETLSVKMNINGLNTVTLAIGDFFPFYDVSGTVLGKVTLQSQYNAATLLTAETAVAMNDELILYDTSATQADKTTVQSFWNSINVLTAETALATNDKIPIYDTSATQSDSITVQVLWNSITNLTAETAVALTDEVPLYDVSATNGDKATVQNLFKAQNLLTEDTAPDATADFVFGYDTSASAAKKIKASFPRKVLTQVPTVSTDCVINYQFRSGYSYRIELSDIEVSSNNTVLTLLMSSDNGSTYVNSASAYDARRIYGTSGVAGDNSIATVVNLTGYGMIANNPLNGTLWMNNPAGGSKWPYGKFDYMMTETGGNIAEGYTHFLRLADMAVDKIKLTSSTDFKAQGTITVWEEPI